MDGRIYTMILKAFKKKNLAKYIIVREGNGCRLKTVKLITGVNV